jgi:hypothetical protein
LNIRFLLGAAASIATIVALAPAFAEPVVIHCPAEPPVVRTLELQERWRIDTEDPASPLIGHFGENKLVVDGDRVYMLDGQLCRIQVYDRDGRHLDTILGEGDGPGEVRNPGQLMLCADGRLAVQHGYPTRLEFVDPDGTPRGRWKIAVNTWINTLQETPAGWFCVYLQSIQSDDPGVFHSEFHVALHNDDGERTRDLHNQPRTRQPTRGGVQDEARDYNPWSTARITADLQVVRASRRDEYRLEWVDLDGQTSRVVTRDVAAHRRTDAELAEMKYRNYSIVHGELRFPERKLCSHDPVISMLEPLPDGSLRVRTSRFDKDLPEGMVCRYDVHDPDGRLRERVEIHDPTGAYDTTYDVIALLPDGQAMVLRNVRVAWRLANDARQHPDLVAKLPPIPDDREDIAFTPIMCDLVTRAR